MIPPRLGLAGPGKARRGVRTVGHRLPAGRGGPASPGPAMNAPRIAPGQC